MLIDNYNRKIDYVRISLTDRCNLRCIYCMPAFGLKKFSHNEILTYEELNRLIKILKNLGVKKFRFTGGEPLIRKDVFEFLENLVLDKFFITTNLAVENLDIERLNRMKIGGINISLDSLNPEKYNYITRNGSFKTFMNNFKRLTLKNIKINVVLIKNFNADEVNDFIEFSLKNNVTVRFIEKMEIIDDELEFVSLEKIKQELIKKGIIEADGFIENNSVSIYHKIIGSNNKIGFITPISHSFCDRCNKIRIKANGDIKLCLFSKDRYNIKEILENESNDKNVSQWLQNIVKKKPLKSPISLENKKSMSEVGG